MSFSFTRRVIAHCCSHGYFNWLPDAAYLRIQYWAKMGKKLHLKNPQTFNEKLQWMKLYDRRPEYTTLVDKYAVKPVIAELIGDQYIIPTLGVWDSFDDIDFNMLPDQFVLKCTHDSGGLVVCRDKSKLDLDAARKKIEKSLKRNYYYLGREWPYKNVPHRIIAEEYKEDSATGALDDYKFFCFDGVVDNVMVVRGRAEGHPKFYHFDKDWNLCRFNRLTRSLPEDFHEDKPPFIDEMIVLAEKISKGYPHVRVDFYEADGNIYFGEFTLYSQNGMETGFDDYSDGYLGSLIHLPE